MSSFAQLTPIGTIRSPFKEPAGTPIQPVFAEGVEGIVEVLPEYAEGLRDLDGTPVLDIKPYVPQYDAFPQSRAEWLEEGGSERTLADHRFRPGGSDSSD